MEHREVDRSKLYATDGSIEEKRRAFTNGGVHVAVYGLGKMGLPLATVYASVTGRVVGVDVDPDRVQTIAAGECPIEGEPGLAAAVQRTVGADTFVPTTNGEAAADHVDVHVVIVPTTLNDDNTPDLSNLLSVVRTIGAGLEAGDVVVVESTVPPGTCADVVRPMLARISDLDPDEFGLAFCPERTMSGSALEDIRRAHPRVVGGVDDESTSVAAMMYDEITENDVLPVSDATTAECVKLFEGVYRDVNIALANELATFTDELGVDVNEAIDRANTQPYCDIHRPGAGVGGHCIPFYPHFLMDALDSLAPLVSTARQTNDSMPMFVVEKVLDAVADDDRAVEDVKVAVLGVTYRPGVNEVRKSPAYPVTDYLSQHGATVYAVDPVREDLSDFDAVPATVDDLPALDLDVAVLLTAHREFEAIDWDALDPMFVVDGRQALDLSETDHTVYTVGTGLAGGETG